MPVAERTILFEDYFDSQRPEDNYLPEYIRPSVTAALRDDSHSFPTVGGPSPGERYLHMLPNTAYCPGCDPFFFDQCGIINNHCKFGSIFLKRRPLGEETDWYHLRAWIKIEGNWDLYNYLVDPENLSTAWRTSTQCLGILMPEGGSYDDLTGAPEYLPWGWERPWASIHIFGEFPDDHGRPHVGFRTPFEIGGHGIAGLNLADLPGYRTDPTEELDENGMETGRWFCFEIAVGELDVAASRGKARCWVNDMLMVEQEWNIKEIYGDGYPEPGHPTGFAFGRMSSPLEGYDSPTNSYNFPYDGVTWGDGMEEPFLERTLGLSISFARITTADGHIGCLHRGTPTEEVPDPDALRCRDDHYETECDLRGECGRVIFKTTGLTREPAGWETTGNGFASPKSSWYRWVAPRNGNFIFRSRGSEVFNEISVHRHTGALPPPRIASSDEDAWDPTASTSAAVEVSVEQGVEYRIRVASSQDGWVVLDFGPPRHLVQDDGWSIDDSARATRERVDVVGTVSGLAVQDDQVGASPTGAGTDPTMEPVVFGETG